jgi:hypothetical protein
MSKRVYFSQNAFTISQQETTPVRIRIQGSHATVKALQTRLQYENRSTAQKEEA